MNLVIKRSTISNCGTAVHISGNVTAEISDLEIVDCIRGFHIESPDRTGVNQTAAKESTLKQFLLATASSVAATCISGAATAYYSG